MLNLLQSIFGGSSQQATNKPVDLTPAEFTDLRAPLAGSLKGLLDSGGGPQYDGPLYSPITGNEQSTLDQLTATTGPGTGRSNLLADTIAGKYLPGQDGANPYLQDAIKAAQRTNLEGLTETLTRSLPGRFTAAGQMVQSNAGGQGGSSAFDRAAAIATRGVANANADIATNMSANAYESERNRQTQAVQLDQAEVDTTIKNLQAQALPRMIQELGIERGLSLFQQRTAALLDILKTIGSVSSPHIAQEGQSTGETQGNAFASLFPKGA